ncbi:hypothetical protein ACQEVZ_05975 [Dactylosporangium sp. CA-152071]|uniref:tetratricopeptide repeat protein n=1 Tax=Dactylosporangium sp. CA-152071 TaxID=3239933 RepID=UPI003D90175A
MTDDQLPAARDGGGLDLASVQSLADFAEACGRLRAGRSYADLRRAARPRSLPAATVSDLLNARSTPTRDTVVTFLLACGLHDDAARRPWLTVWERVATAGQPQPAGAVRVRLTRPRLLGVHAAIQVSGTVRELPPYVPRDVDADLRSALAEAAAEGGFVLLLGGSSVGKTRALHEAVLATLPEWWLLHPADAAAIAGHAQAPTPRTVLWLDELQRYLNRPAALPAGTLRQLVTAGTVVVATLWPEEYTVRTARTCTDQQDLYANDRELLGLARLIQVPETFSRAERRHGEALAGTDPRIRIALDTTDAGFTQVLAAGPALIHRWEHAPAADCYGRAVITAALDARRVGAQQPATRAYLEAAAPAYLTAAQQATAPADWLDRALAYATGTVHGAAACLTPVPAGMGAVAGYLPADYLHQHAQRTRRTAALPDLVWNALLTHRDPRDSLGLAGNAGRRGRPEHAITFYRGALATDGLLAAVPLAATLIQHGAGAGADEGLQILRDHAAGNTIVAHFLTDMLVHCGRVDEAVQVLRELADGGDRYGVRRLTALLAEYSRLDEALQVLREYSAGDPYAYQQLAELLVEHGCHAQAARVLSEPGAIRSFSEMIDMAAEFRRAVDVPFELPPGIAEAAHAHQLAADLAGQGHIEEALQLLRDRAAAGDEGAVRRLVSMLTEHGRVDEALQVLRDRAATSTSDARWLAGMLKSRGRVEEAMQVLRDRAAGGDVHCLQQLATMLEEHDRVDEALQTLREHAADASVGYRLTGMLVRYGRADELLDEVAAGTTGAVEALPRLRRTDKPTAH